MQKILLVFLITLVTFSVNASLLLDDFEDGDTINLLGGDLVSNTDGFSDLETNPAGEPGWNSNRCLKLEWQLNPGAPVPYANVVYNLKAGAPAQDLSTYHGLRFYARGKGDVNVQLPIEATREEYNHFQFPFTLSPEWRYFELPFSRFAQSWGTSRVWDSASIFAVQIGISDSSHPAGELYLDNIEFYTSDESTEILYEPFLSRKPKINQLGYYRKDKKFFVLTSDQGELPFTVYTISGEQVLTGTMEYEVIDDTSSSGEFVCKGDFSDLTTPGEYYIEAGEERSYPFQVCDNLYTSLARDVLRAFSLIRCGTEIDDPVTGLHHPPCHTDDAETIDSDYRDFSGGWHNAGDYGKWTHEAAFSIAYMLWLYELKGNTADEDDLGIPESGNGIPDILDEARWGLEWLFKMQNADGSVYHKVDTEPSFCWGIPPEEDPHPRFARYGSQETQTPSTIDAADFSAVMAQASRIFNSKDPLFAEKCRLAAEHTWNWLNENPPQAQNDPYYSDTSYAEELFWAQTEMYRLTNSPELESEIREKLDTAPIQHPIWLDPSYFGYMSLSSNPRTPPGMKIMIQDKVEKYCSNLLLKESGYGVLLTSGEYIWGSNGWVMGRANMLLYGFLISGNSEYLEAARRQMDYLLGVNSLQQCYITGYGTKRNAQPYHWSYSVYNFAIPGWSTGGPNSHYSNMADVPLQDLINKGTPPAKCFLDLCTSYGSYSSNEGSTDVNAALVFLSGFIRAAEKETPGDVNSDGNVNILDALMTAQFSVGLYPAGFNPSTADMNGDDKVNIVDSLMIAYSSINIT